jgi:hypothetical protein
MGDACSVAGANCCRVFTAADPDQISAAKLKMPCSEEAWCDIAEKAEKGTFGLGRGPPTAMKKCVIVAVVLAIAAIWCRQSFAQSGAPVNDTDYLSKETENPVTRKITVPLRYEADFLDGADKLTKYPPSNSTRRWCHSG